MTALLPVPACGSLENVESEYALVSSLLYEARRIEQVIDLLAPEHFADPFFSRIYGVITREYSRGNALNALLLKPFIEADAAYEAMGGMKFIANLTNSNSLLVNVKATADQIKDMAQRRELLAGLRDSIALVTDIDQPLEVVVDATESALAASVDQSDTVRQISAANAMGALLKAAGEPKRTIISKMVPSMDRLLSLRPKQLAIGGGRPGMGKTAAALSYSLGAAQNGHGVLFVSLEMGAEELAARMAADLAFNGHNGVPYADINSEDPSPRAIRAMGDAQAMLRDMPLQIIDAGSLAIGRLERMVRRWKRRFAARGQSLDMVVVDYLQLLRCDDKHKSAYEAVSEISRRLKAMAKDHDVAVFALAQLSREVEKRADKRPQLSDLRDSGQIEQDADAVLFFYRHAYYAKDDPAALALCENAIDFICAKRRNGVTEDAVGDFYGKFQAVRG